MFPKSGFTVAAGVLALAVQGAPAWASEPGAAHDRQTAPAEREAPVPALRLTVEEAVRRALDNNPDLALVRLDAEAEMQRVSQSQGAFVPMFSTVLGRSNAATPPSNFLLGDHGVDAGDWFSSTGIRQRLPRGGGVWSVSWEASRTTSNDPLTSFDPSLQSGFQIAFSQPLLKDRALDQARFQQTVARTDHATSELRFREAAVQTVAAVKQAYWTFKALLANVTVQQRSLDLALELVRQNKVRVDLGQAPPLDLIQAEAEVAQRRETLIRAKTAAGDAEDRLRRLIIKPSEASFWAARLDPVDEPAAGGAAPPDIEGAVAKALEERYDVARARNDLKNADTNVEFYRGQKMPDVRLEASYRGNGLGGTRILRSGGFPGTVSGRLSSGFGSVLDQVFDGSYDTWSVGVTISYPLGRSYEEAGLARATIERRQAATRIASLQLEAAEAIRRAGRQVISTRERIPAAHAGAELAEQRLETERRRYEAGLSTSFLVTQAQRDVVQAQVNLLQATLDHQSSLVSFEALQQAPPLGDGDTVALRAGDMIVPVPPAAPQGLFREGRR